MPTVDRLLLCVIGLAILATPSPATETVDLRGYGKVTTSFAGDRAEFSCESPDQAERLQDKLLADLLWDAPAGPRAGQVVEAGGIKPVVHELPPFGAIVVGRLDRTVLAVGGADATAVAARAGREALLRDPRCRFQAGKPHPVWLDVFDLGAVRSYTYAMQSNHGFGLSSHWPFLAQFGLGGIAYHLGGGMLSSKSAAPGILSFADTDVEVREAGRNHGMIVPGISVGGALPAWATNLHPDSILRPSPTGLGEHDGLILMESYGMPRAQREDTGLWSLRQTMRRYVGSPDVGGWQILDGVQGIETLSGYQPYADVSPAGLRSYRAFLREARGLDLKAVGERHYGDPARFRSWDEVMPMDGNGFFGDLDPTCLLFSAWQWQPVADQTAPAVDGPWRGLRYPGSDEMHTVPAADAFYRIAFDPGAWLAQHRGQEPTLVLGRCWGKKPARLEAWLNGQALALEPRWIGTGPRPLAVAVRSLLRPGRNELLLRVPGGKLLSPCFLTPHRAEEYPAADRTLNARYIDLRDWHYHALGIKQREAFELARGLDPERSFILPAGGGWEMAGTCADIAVDLGSSIQNTGREAFYQPWWARLGRIAGFYGSSEPSGTAKPDALDRLFGWILIDGDAAHTLYWQLEDYIAIERESGWFTGHQRLLALVGKSLPLPPQVAVFRSTQTMRYAPEHYYNPVMLWDVGRGELNDAHVNWGYAGERELRRGLPPEVKVVFDAGSEVMEQTTIDALAAFVSRGGTYVALHNSGRHDPVQADAWPISRLTGCRVVGTKAKGRIRFANGLSIFTGWDGRELDAEGIAMDWQGNDHAKDTALHLAPQSSDVAVLATWADGTAAVTSRSLGKGRVVCLGASFWRNARDRNGAWLTRDDKLGVLRRLLADLGVERGAEASTPAVWVDEKIAKHGHERWLVAFNTGQAPVTADLGFRAAARPAEVRELVSGASVPFTYADGRVTLAGIDFANTESKVFAIARGGLVDGIPAWWSEKTTYWKKPTVPAVGDPPPVPGSEWTLPLDAWRFLADRDGAVSAQAAWTALPFDAARWGAIAPGPWGSVLPELQDYAGIGLYRTTFTVPAAWKGAAISLNLFGGRTAKVIGKCALYLNGTRIEDPAFLADLGGGGHPTRIAVDGLLNGGVNVLALQIAGAVRFAGEDLAGLCSSVYLQAERPLAPDLNLATWSVVRLDGGGAAAAAPIAGATGSYLQTELTVPAAWQGHEIALRIQTATPWLSGLMVNGTLIRPAQFTDIGRFGEWNLSPWVEAGKPLRIQLWSRTLPLYQVPDPQKPAQDAKLDLISARVGCLAGK